MAPNKWPVTFRVYTGATDGQGLFVHARVFDTHAAMLTALRQEDHAEGGSGYASDTQGAMQRYKHYTPRSPRVDGCLGRVSLHRSRLGTEVVSHEFAHAMFAWVERKRLTSQLHQMPAEEQACYVLGRLLRRFVSRAYALGLYDADGR